MLLKPIFEKAPLKRAVRLPLRPGQLLLEDELGRSLTALAGETPEQPILWEGLLRTAALLNARPEKLPVADLIRDALSRQAEDGSLPCSLTDSLAVMRAAWALYEITCTRSLLESMLRWCGYVSASWEEVLRCDAIRRSPADLLELTEQLYRVTGKKALLSMMDRIRRDCMSWSGVLHTFSVQQPFPKVTPLQELRRGLAEEGSEEGFYTRQALTCHGLSLADGARASALTAAYSGNGPELSAARIGWEKLSRYHASPAGAICCDELVMGNAPDVPADTAALGAWLEALCAAMEQDDEARLWNALALMSENALPRALQNGRVALSQTANCLKEKNAEASFRLDETADRRTPALARLLRGYAALRSHALTLTPEGISVNLPVSGKAVCVLDGKAVTLVSTADSCGMTVTVHTKEPANFRMKLRMPDSVTDGRMKVSRGGSAQVVAGESRDATRAWQDGDTVTMSWKPQLRTVQGFHQGVCVYLGSSLMTLPAGETWAVAACGEPELNEQGQVLLPVVPVEWKNAKGLPVLPAGKGEERRVALEPYADTVGISLFPRLGSR